MADLTEAQSSQSVKIAGASASTGIENNFLQVDANGNAQVIATSAGSAAGGTAASQSDLAGGQFNASAPLLTTGQQAALQLDASGKLITSATVSADAASSYSPDNKSYIVGKSSLQVDTSGRLETHSTILTDEGSFRDDFSGSSLTAALTGTLNFINGSTSVTGVGTLFTTEIGSVFYIKKTADAEANYVQVSYVINDTNLVLETVYPGTTGSSTGVYSNWKTDITGGSISVASSICSLISSMANGNAVRIRRQGDYLPYNFLAKCSITQRIANQAAIIGMQDNPLSPIQQAVFVFDGTTNTTVKCRTSYGSAATDIQETTVTLATGLNSSQSLRYQIDLSANQVSFLINDIVVAIHKDHIPSPYTVLELVFGISNSAIVTTTTLAVDWIYFANVDQVQITSDFTGEPLKVQLVGKSTTTGLPVDLALDKDGNLIVTALTGFNADFSFGDVTTASIAQFIVRRNTYTEQTSDAQRSIVSTSALDTALGTGARTLIITYFTSALLGPFTETITLNGLTAVNTVATNICYIESMEVKTAGTGGSNAGVINLKSLAAGAGVTIGFINANDIQTFWAHHYIQAGKICNITGVSCSHNGTTVGSGGVFVVKGISLNTPNAIENQVTDFIRLYGQSSTFARTYTSPVKVAGPARIAAYVTPETSTATIYRCSIDFFEP